MNRKILIASTTAVAALGLTTWALRGPSDGTTGDPLAGEDAAKFSNRPASKVGGPRGSHVPPMPSGTARLSDRSAARDTAADKAAQRRDLLLSPAQRAQLAAARQNRPPLPSAGGSKAQAKKLKAKDRAIAKMREDVRTAIQKNPDGWIETYASLNRDFAQNNGNYYGRGVGGGLPSDNPTPADPVETPAPETPAPEGGDSTDPGTPETPETPEVDPIELPVPLDEAQRLAEEFRLKQKASLEGKTEREDRFKPVEQ